MAIQVMAYLNIWQISVKATSKKLTKSKVDVTYFKNRYQKHKAIHNLTVLRAYACKKEKEIEKAVHI